MRYIDRSLLHIKANEPSHRPRIAPDQEILPPERLSLFLHISNLSEAPTEVTHPPPVLEMLQQIPVPVVDPSNRIQPAFLLCVQPPTKGRFRVFHLLFALTGRNRYGPLTYHPVQCDSGGSFPDFLTDAFQLVNDRLDFGPGDVTEVTVSARRVRSRVLSAETADSNRGIGDCSKLASIPSEQRHLRLIPRNLLSIPSSRDPSSLS